MILRLREFDQFPARISLAPADGSWTFVYEGVNSISNLNVTIEVNKTDDEFYCRGKIKCSASIECARCLDGYNIELAQDVDFFAIPATTVSGVRHKDAEDYVVFHGQDMTADLSDIVRQSIILALPIMPLCREECAGLCSRCGANLNREECTCSSKVIDPRWDGLQRITSVENKNHKG